MAKKNASKNYSSFAPKSVVITIVVLAVLATTVLFIAAYNQPQNSTRTETHANVACGTPGWCPRGYISVCKPYVGWICVRR